MLDFLNRPAAFGGSPHPGTCARDNLHDSPLPLEDANLALQQLKSGRAVRVPAACTSRKRLTSLFEKQAAIDIADADHPHHFSVFRDGNSSEIFHAHVGGGL
jgi:hypothetical protein